MSMLSRFTTGAEMFLHIAFLVSDGLTAGIQKKKVLISCSASATAGPEGENTCGVWAVG